VWLALCASRFGFLDIRMSFFVGVFYAVAVSFWQFLFAAWLGILSHNTAYLDAKSESGQIAAGVFHALLSVVVFYLFKRRKRTAKDAFRFASMVSVAGFVAVITLSEQTVLKIAEDTLGMWAILAVVLMMSLLVYRLRRQYETERELAKLKSQQAEILERDYVTLNNVYALNAKLFHDFHNHIGVLQQMLSHQKVDEAVRYLNALQAPLQEMTDMVWPGDETMDYLINSKAAAAKEDGIPMQIQVEFPRHTDIRSADLCAILGNLLDNALEASRQIPETKQRGIRLTIRRIHQMLVIKVENRFAALPSERDGVLQTTKEQNGLHGWGLKSAQTAAEKYDGMVQTSCTDEIFRAVATLSYKGVSVD
ncbi:MAG: GHKL domain-containing protein, partial [Lachnospiraceae bacterium]|nr:GHKL domain-containing protein [Lachnospiraceae bacterium]